MASPLQSKPKLVHITTVPESLGFVRGQVGYMQDHGFEVSAISSPGQLLDDFGQTERIPVHALEMLRRISPLNDLGAIRKMISLLHALRPSIAHSHTPKGGLIGMIGAWLARVPIRIYHIHGMPYLTAKGWKRVLLRLTEQVSCALAHQVLCVSPSVMAEAVADGVCPARKIKVLHQGSINGVDALGRFNPAHITAATRHETRERFGIPDEAVVVGFVGRLVRDKGLVELMEAWSALEADWPHLHLLIVGPFEPQDPIPEATVEKLHTTPRIHLVGTDWNTPPLYGAMDLVVLPTYREGLPVVPLEAASMGLPVVATRVPGCVDAISDGVTGTLVPSKDAAALAAALGCYLKRPELRVQHGRAGRERMMRDFRQEVIWEAMHREYVALLKSKKLPVLMPDCDYSEPAT